MKYTIFLTQDCNLNCQYCYIIKRPLRMSLTVARQVIDFIYANTPESEKIDIGFFGGEPLLEFDLIKQVIGIIEHHPAYRTRSLEISLVTNGTIFDSEIADFLKLHCIGFCLSCDGPPEVQDHSRPYKNGMPSSSSVENTIIQAKLLLPTVLVNAVITPRSAPFMPQTVEYFTSLGLKTIYLNPDFSAPWTEQDAAQLNSIFDDLGDIYIESYRRGQPIFISPLDSKIAIIMRGGYQAEDKCQMGKKEFAFTPEGNIFPCERIVGDGMPDSPHCIGKVGHPLKLANLSSNPASGAKINIECLTCGVYDYCMNWCGCSNYMSSGYYNRVGPYLCATERASIQTAIRIIETLEAELGPLFFEHVSGKPSLNSLIQTINE